MSPSNYQDSDHVTKGVTTMINGSRPSPLRINKDSHAIHKHIDQNHHSAAKNHGGGGAAKRQPVIIYTHSPKVIHAQARDFMALVQKLTGMSRADEDDRTAVKSESEEGSFLSSDETKNNNNNINNVGYEETESCSVMADEIMKQQDCPQLYKFPNNSYFDGPIFAPNSNDFYCSSTRANQISPSLMDIMKGFPDY